MGDASYLAWLTGFHSRAHKHADDLTFVWCEGSTEIVVDGGKFGYGDLLENDDPRRLRGSYYASRERQYVESARAHNTVVRGRAGDIDRRRSPYGSGGPSIRVAGSAFKMTAIAEHRTHTHRRSLRFEPGRRLLVRDVIDTMSDTVDGVTAWLNLNGEFDIELRDERSVSFIHQQSGMLLRLEVTSAEAEVARLARGQVDPLSGWRSIADGELIPTWNIGISSSARPRVTLDYHLSVTLG